jgi:tRNA-splicing ligase RtcB
MPRGEAKRKLTRRQFDEQLSEYGVRVLAAGIDEMPAVYKDIDKVIDIQIDAGLIELVGRFEPRIVLMASGGKAED